MSQMWRSVDRTKRQIWHFFGMFKLSPLSIYFILNVLFDFKITFNSFVLFFLICIFATMKHIEVVAAIIRKGDRIFATQRGYGEWKDWWEFPGGKMKRQI